METKQLVRELIQELSVEEACGLLEEYGTQAAKVVPHLSPPMTHHVDAASMFSRLGALLTGLKLGKGMLVLDFGAGTGWIARLFQQMQCATISVDPSLDALHLGRESFTQFPVKNALALPQFSHFDGHRLQVTSNSVDRICGLDAFFSTPNPKAVLREFFRVLKSGGIAGFSKLETSPFHRLAEQYRRNSTGVLAPGPQVAELRDMAHAVGFGEITLPPPFPGDGDGTGQDTEVAALDEKHPWSSAPNDRSLADLNQSPVFFFTKGSFIADSRSAVGLQHELEIIGPTSCEVTMGTPLAIDVRLHNVGQATWLRPSVPFFGAVYVGAHLCNATGAVLQWDAARTLLDRDMLPGEQCDRTITVVFPAPGVYVVVIDLIAASVGWFESMGNTPQRVRVVVR